jgi:hypothetical protein
MLGAYGEPEAIQNRTWQSPQTAVGGTPLTYAEEAADMGPICDSIPNYI